MIRTFCFLFLASLAGAPAMAAPDKYTIDKDHTHILFSVSHVGFSRTIGRMDEFDGHFTFDEKEAQKSDVEFTVKAASVDTGVPALDKTLRGEKFLNSDKYPLIHFKSIGVIVTGNKTGELTGKLTLLGVTRSVTLHVKYNRSGIHPFTNNYVSGFSADFSFKRSDFGMKAYIPDVGDEVDIHIEVEGTDPLKHPGNSKAPH